MASKRDLAEACSFSRRRLVTAFVSGAPAGCEVEPARLGRTIVGGVALAVLLAAGAAIAGVLAPRTPTDWSRAGLVVSRETGAAYVVVPADAGGAADGAVELRPVINITSAQLILGPDATPTLVPQDAIDEQHIGEDIGILGAPAGVPSPDRLVDSGWTSCTADGAGIDVRVATDPAVEPAEGRQLLVRSEGGLWLVVQPPADDAGPQGAHVLRVPQQGARGNRRTDLLTLALRAGVAADAPRVPREWLDLFRRGGDLDESGFHLDGFGRPADGAGRPGSGIPAGARVGDVLTGGDGSALLTAQGPVTLDPFALAVYTHVETPGGAVEPRRVDRLPSRAFASAPYAGAHWPTDLLAPLAGDVTPCAELVARPGRAPAARLTRSSDPDPAVADRPADRTSITVDPGRGAYVLSGGWADESTGAPFVVDATGRADPLSGPGAADRLGYGGYPVPVVPDSWLDLFDRGVELSTDAALCPPVDPGRERGSCR